MNKKIVILSFSLLFSAIGFAQEPVKATAAKVATDSSSSDAKLSFETDLHDFGEIEYAGEGTYDFKFTNTGTTPLIISNAKGSCGCTVPTYPKNVPIAPGQSEVIKVTYDTKRVGHFMKTVNITSNTKEQKKVITIRGKVLAEVKEPAFPAKGSNANSAIPFEEH